MTGRWVRQLPVWRRAALPRWRMVGPANSLSQVRRRFQERLQLAGWCWVDRQAKDRRLLVSVPSHGDILISSSGSPKSASSDRTACSSAAPWIAGIHLAATAAAAALICVFPISRRAIAVRSIGTKLADGNFVEIGFEASRIGINQQRRLVTDAVKDLARSLR